MHSLLLDSGVEEPGFARVVEGVRPRQASHVVRVSTQGQFIVGSKDLTKDWNTYVQGVKNLGLQQYLHIAQSAIGQPFDTTSPLFRGGAP